MRKIDTLGNYLGKITEPVIKSLVQAINLIRTDVNNLPKTIDISKVVRHPVAVTAITPDVSLGGIHEYLVNSATVNLNVPIFPDNWTAGTVQVYIKSTFTDGCRVYIDPALEYTHGDGLFLLGEQTYLFTLNLVKMTSDNNSFSGTVTSKLID